MPGGIVAAGNSLDAFCLSTHQLTGLLTHSHARVKAMAKVEHESIVRTFTFENFDLLGEGESHDVSVIQWLPGETLEVSLAGERFSERDAIAICIGVIDGLIILPNLALFGSQRFWLIEKLRYLYSVFPLIFRISRIGWGESPNIVATVVGKPLLHISDPNTDT